VQSKTISESPSYVLDTANYVRDLLESEGSGHDWWHIYRVWQNAIKICDAENADRTVVELAALLHDIADWKFNDGNLKLSGEKAREWMNSISVPLEIQNHVCAIIDVVSFKGAGVKDSPTTLEGKIVRDADRLDAIGAIGVARTFTYGGFCKQAMHDPDVQPRKHDSFEEYRNTRTTTINHFYEKILLLKDRMETEAAKQIAKDRHEFLEMYLTQFFKEWDGIS
jgi:uncharacterized protein